MARFVRVTTGGLRIVGAVAAKDVIDAIRNRTTLSTLISAVLIMVMYKGMPALGRAITQHDIFVYDTGNSRLLSELEDSPRFRVQRARSMEHLRELMSEADQGELGLVVPANLDQVLESEAGPELSAYVTWADRAAAPGLALSLQRQLEELLGRPVNISIDGNIVFPPPDSMGTTRMVAFTVAMMLFCLGTILVPQLMFEERRAKTIDALMVSPASASQLVAGKALAGMLYCLATGGAFLALNLPFVVQWGLAIVAIAIGALCSVALGLLIGTLLETRQQMMPWVCIIFSILLPPAILNVAEPLVPEVVRPVLTWTPVVATAILMRVSFSNVVPPAQVMFGLAIASGSTALLLGLTAWRLRRWDR